jgi:hypothetical protein
VQGDVISVNRVVGKKRIVGKKCGLRRRGTRGQFLNDGLAPTLRQRIAEPKVAKAPAFPVCVGRRENLFYKILKGVADPPPHKKKDNA